MKASSGWVSIGRVIQQCAEVFSKSGSSAKKDALTCVKTTRKHNKEKVVALRLVPYIVARWICGTRYGKLW